MVTCPHGDATCPCQDGDTCHYEGVDAWPCPSFPAEDDRGNHCHMEGCRWHEEGCGLAKIGIHSRGADPVTVGTPVWLCGATRSAHEMMNEMDREDMAAGKPPYFGGPTPFATRPT